MNPNTRPGTVFVVAHSAEEMRSIITHIVRLSCWFKVEPQRNGEFTIEVKGDVAHIAFPTHLEQHANVREF